MGCGGGLSAYEHSEEALTFYLHHAESRPNYESVQIINKLLAKLHGRESEEPHNEPIECGRNEVIIEGIEVVMSAITKIKRSDLPRDIDFTESGNTLYMTMNQDCASENMQDNNAAFEAWALVAKAAGYCEVVLSESESTEELQGIKKSHYSRFLYRVSCFVKGFEWFSVSDELEEKIDEFVNTELSRDDLFVNAPLSKPTVPDDKSHEAVMENLLVQDNNRDYLNNILGTSIETFYQQLPVGLFGGSVVKGNEIFPRGKAAIDIWGLDGSTFHLIELKVKNNQNLGVLSEVFFYACFVSDMYCNRHLETKDSDDLQKCKTGGEDHRGYTQLINAKVDSVVAYILTEKKHPRLDGAFSELKECKLNGIKFEDAICRPLFSEVSKTT